MQPEMEPGYETVGQRKRKLLKEIQIRAPGLEVKKNLSLAATQKVLNDVTWGTPVAHASIKKRKTRAVIGGSIDVDRLVKVVVYGRHIEDIMNAGPVRACGC